jgi:hypothetical protein
VILLASGCARVDTTDTGKTKNMNDVTSFPSDIKLRVGFAVVDGPAWRAELTPAINESNRKARLEGLADQLNPAILDAEKVAAFLAVLPKLPAETLRSLAGRTLSLDSAGLMLGASAPTRPATFAGPIRLEIEDVQGDVVHAGLILQVDCARARERAAEARARIKTADDEVKALEARLPAASGTPDKERETLLALSVARRCRSAVAYVWQKNAKAWTECDGADSAAKADLAAAARAVDSYALPLGSGMPP